jgi:hypothetical protein
MGINESKGKEPEIGSFLENKNSPVKAILNVNFYIRINELMIRI